MVMELNLMYLRNPVIGIVSKPSCGYVLLLLNL